MQSRGRRRCRQWRRLGWMGAVALVGVAACADDDDDDGVAATDAASEVTSATTEPSSREAVGTAVATDTTEPATTESPGDTAAAATIVPATTAARTTEPTETTPSAPTIDELVERDAPLLIAHQGGEHDYPSSTLYAYGESVQDGADVLELDVHLSADGEIVVIHDATVDNRTDGTGPIAEKTAAELAALDAGYCFVPGEGSRCGEHPDDAYPFRGVRTGERPPPEGYTADDFGVPTLREVAERFPHMPLDIEIKGGGDGIDTIEPLVAELRDLGREDSVVIASFDHDVTEAFREYAPDIEVSPGEDGLIAWYAEGVPLDGYRIIQVPHVFGDLDVLAPDILERARDDGFIIWVWIGGSADQTVELYEDILGRGVDGVLVDRPSQLRALIDSM